MTAPLVVVGDLLLDRDLEGSVERICPDAPVPVVDLPTRGRSRPGGAGLAAVLAAVDRTQPNGSSGARGPEVVLVSALAEDQAGHELAALLELAGVTLMPLRLDGSTPEKVRVRAAGQSLLRLDHGGGPAPVGPPDEQVVQAVAAAGAVLVADYGRGVAGQADLRGLMQTLAAAGTPVVWDPHLRGPAPVPGVHLATPNQAEAIRLTGEARQGTAGAASAAQTLARRWSATAVVVTMGEGGAVVSGPDGSPLVVPTEAVAHADSCGAGDRFASAAALALSRGAVVSEAVEESVRRASAFVADGGASGGWRPGQGSRDSRNDRAGKGVDGRAGADAEALVRDVRCSGGTVVATGGCFDLLHAGHVSMLRAARSLGDCLIVCLNSDGSVRRLKGPDRPLQPEEDRAALLLALGCVDAVVVFDEDTPAAVLDRLRPDLFAKGADYTPADLPEGRALARWGGRAVVLPYLGGRSTTRLLEEATRHGQ